MALKLPGIFKKPIPEKDFEKRFLRFIELNSDQEFLRSQTELKEGQYFFKTPTTASEAKRLKILSRAITSNRGLVKRGPLILVLTFFAALGVFYLFFLNPLLQSSLERGLESLFGARSEVSSFNVDLFRLRIRIGDITVADRNAPMTNLFQIHRLELRLNPAAAFRGRLYIQEGRADAILFGTPRGSSGLLPGSPATSPGPSKPKNSAPPLVNWENFSAQDLLDREKDTLKSKKAYEDAAKAYADAVEKWKLRITDTEKRVTEAQHSAQSVFALDVKSLNTPSAISEALGIVRTLSSQAQGLTQELDTLNRDFTGDLKTATDLEKAARSSVDEDWIRLKSYVDPKSGAAMEALEPSIREILSDSAQRYVAYGQKALDLILKLKQKDGKSKTKAVPGPRGRDVVFPSTQYPLFTLALLHSDFTVGSPTSGTRWNVELRDLSSDSDLIGEPTSLKLSVAGSSGAAVSKAGADVATASGAGADVATAAGAGRAGWAVDSSAVADFRSNAKDRFSFHVSGRDLPFDGGSSFSALGIGGFSGTMTARVDGTGSINGSLAGEGTIRITQAQLRQPSTTLAQAVAEAVATVPSIDVALQFAQDQGQEPRISLQTNLNDMVQRIVQKAMDKYAKTTQAELETAFKNYVGAELESQLVSKEDANNLLGTLQGDRASSEKLTKSLDAKKAELENRGKALGRDTVQKALGGDPGSAIQKATDTIKKIEVPKF